MEAQSSASAAHQVVVLPGDVICKVTTDMRLGSGLTQLKDDVVATRAGLLRDKDGNKLWIDSPQVRVRMTMRARVRAV